MIASIPAEPLHTQREINTSHRALEASANRSASHRPSTAQILSKASGVWAPVVIVDLSRPLVCQLVEATRDPLRKQHKLEASR